MKYEKIEVSVIELENEDMIVTSGDCNATQKAIDEGYTVICDGVKPSASNK